MSTARQVLRTWIRRTDGGPMEARDGIDTVVGEGVVDDHARGRKRHVTLLFQGDWEDTIADLGQDVDPSARRANVLVSGGGGGALIGHRVRIGEVLLDVVGETTPCAQMDEAAPGLQEALRPALRGGVWGRVLEAGRIAPGDRLEIVADA